MKQDSGITEKMNEKYTKPNKRKCKS